RFLSQWSAEVRAMRRSILQRAAEAFSPDLMIVDKRPAGIDEELLDTLTTLRQRGTRLVLGVRDILDHPTRTRPLLEETNTFELIDRHYDEVWIYGTSDVFDHLGNYGYPASAADRTTYTGYLRRPVAPRTPRGPIPRVLVTTGGGEDGEQMIHTYLEGLRRLPDRHELRTTVVFGPQLADVKRDALIARYGRLENVEFHDFVADLTRHYAAADLVVAMAGYNTVCELLSFGHRAVLVPRSEPVQEQLIRARRLHEMGRFDLVEPSELTPRRLMSKVLAQLEPGSRPVSSIDLDGLSTIRGRVRSLLTERASWLPAAS
ncbi:MAG: glycosyltransferase family protein, partial [Acidimicrobiia bacterium]